MSDNFESTPSAEARRRTAKSTDIRFGNIKAAEMLKDIDSSESLPNSDDDLGLEVLNPKPDDEKIFKPNSKGNPQDFKK